MFRYTNALKSLGVHVVFLYGVIGVVGIALMYSMHTINNLSKDFTIRIEPGIRETVTRKIWEVGDAYVYDFAFVIMQRINTWNKGGEKDYSKNIFHYQHYLTPSCHKFFEEDYQRKKESGSVQNRIRYALEHPDYKYEKGVVEQVRRGEWNVDLMFVIKEYVYSEEVKSKPIHWPVRVVAWDIGDDLNPKGLAIDCFYDAPKIIDGE